MPGKMLECDGCHKIMRSDNLKNHLQTCKELRKDDDGGGDVGDINVKDSQTTKTKSETTEQIVGKKDYHRKVNCQGCDKPMRSDNIKRHKQTCQVLRNKRDNERDASGMNEKDSQTTTIKSETIGQKLADIVQIALKNRE